MKRIFTIIAVAALVVVSASCSKSRAEQMAMFENVQVTCNPEVLEAVAGTVTAEVSITYPDGYFYPKALLSVTPVIVYEGGEEVATPVTFQGEKVKDNNRVVSSKGGTVKSTFTFPFKPGMEKSQLELRSVVFVGENRAEAPALKVADGCNTTYMLAKAKYTPKPDTYQDVINKSAEGAIMYDVNSDRVKKSELKSASIKEFQAALAEIEKEERNTITGNQIVAYASPEGGQAYNAKLSDKRAASAQKAWDKVTGGKDSELQLQSIGQDWEGFKEAVEASNIKDKELILRVLSMYSDPAVRESEIRNMSQIYTEINQKVFPILRRARLVTNYQYNNLSNEELVELSNNYVGSLDEPALLRVAAISKDNARKVELYNLAAKKYNSEIANFNLACMSVDEGKFEDAQKFLKNVAASDGDAINLKGVIALKQGNAEEALKLFQKAGTNDAKVNVGVALINLGKYNEALAQLKGTGCTNEAIANLLVGKVDDAAKCAKCKCGLGTYVNAIIAARKGDAAGVKSNLENVKCSCLKDRAAKDIEFANYR